MYFTFTEFCLSFQPKDAEYNTRRFAKMYCLKAILFSLNITFVPDIIIHLLYKTRIYIISVSTQEMLSKFGDRKRIFIFNYYNKK